MIKNWKLAYQTEMDGDLWYHTIRDSVLVIYPDKYILYKDFSSRELMYPMFAKTKIVKLK